MSLLKHVWYLAMLDVGEHWCIVCHAQNGELTPSCPGHRLAPQVRAEQRKRNELTLGVDTWVLVSTFGDDDEVTLTTIMHKGVTIAP